MERVQELGFQIPVGRTRKIEREPPKNDGITETFTGFMGPYDLLSYTAKIEFKVTG